MTIRCDRTRGNAMRGTVVRGARRARACALMLLLGIAGSAHAQQHLRHHTDETRWHHAPLPVDAVALASFVMPEGERPDSVEIRFVNDAATTGEADVIVIAADDRGWPLEPRLDLCFPVRVSVPAHADTLLRVRSTMPPGFGAASMQEDGRAGEDAHPGVHFLAGAVILSGGLTVRMDRSAGTDSAAGRGAATHNLFGLPRTDTTGVTYGSRFADGRIIGNWYITVCTARTRATHSQNASAQSASSQSASAQNASVQTTVPAAAPPRPPVPHLAEDARKSEISIRSSYAVVLAERSSVDLRVVDAREQSVRVLASDSLAAGTHFFSWDGRTQEGGDAGSGVYHLVLRINGTEQERHRLMHP